MNIPNEIAIVVVVDENNGIGRDGGLLCHLPNDLKHFKTVTTNHSIIMGRNTFESLPKGALPNRTNIVITSDEEKKYPGCIVVRSIEEAFQKCKDEEKVFIIGGGRLYNSTMHYANKLYLTRIHHVFDDVDTYFPDIDLENWSVEKSEYHKADERNKFDHTFLIYNKTI